MSYVIAIVVLVVLAGAIYALFGRGKTALPPGPDSIAPRPKSLTDLERESRLPAQKAEATEAEVAGAGAERPAKGEAEAAAASAEASATAREPTGRTAVEQVSEDASALEAALATNTAAPAGIAPSHPPPPGSAEDVAALRKSLASTRGGFIARLARIFGGKKEFDPNLINEIEEVLISADIGVKTTSKILDRLRERMAKSELGDSDRVWTTLREEAQAILGGAGKGGVSIDRAPFVILVVGVNGVGKTTTIGKLASRFLKDGKKVLLAAGDTFRAAAVIQLEVWGRRVGCPVVKGKDNADPSSVIFEAIRRAKDEGIDVVIADTAGRLHTKAPLMDELTKIGRTVEKALERPADEIFLVLDSTNGQNASQQAQIFRDALKVSGIVLTKMDGTAKGGVILGIVDEHRIPVRFIGVGERVEDLRVFEAAAFTEALFAKPDDESIAA